MIANWPAHPLVVYGLLAAGMVLCLYLVYTVKLEMYAARKRTTARLNGLEAALAALRAQLQELQGDLESLQAEPGAAARSAVPRSGINLTRRAQVLRLHRRGESVPTIAGALSLPQKEVELLLKVQRLIVEQS